MSSYLDHNPEVGFTRELCCETGWRRLELSLLDYLSCLPKDTVVTGLIADVHANDPILLAFYPLVVFGMLFRFAALFQC
jgi:hypothetical protein